ncbi:hypothetical protein ARTHRO9V_130129 [Arthrobacter sp. 9V]|nr:hypothetical protein ARTHRO9V_130129 [Arthrobacter sp. 9V]
MGLFALTVRSSGSRMGEYGATPRPVRRARRERVRSLRPGKVGRTPGASTGTAAAVRPGTLVAGTATALRLSSPPAGGADVARSSTEVPLTTDLILPVYSRR